MTLTKITIIKITTFITINLMSINIIVSTLNKLIICALNPLDDISNTAGDVFFKNENDGYLPVDGVDESGFNGFCKQLQSWIGCLDRILEV